MANKHTRSLRKRLTRQETKLWLRLRTLKPSGFHFRKQAPIDRYIVDFVAFRQRIIVEADGGQLALQTNKTADRTRDDFLKSQGFKVLRFWNSEIDENLDGVMDAIVRELGTPTPALRADPPHRGEG